MGTQPISIDRPLTINRMAEDTTALLRQIGIKEADIFCYSMGAGIAQQIAISHPDLVQKLVVASVTYNNRGFQPGLLSGLTNLKPENLAGTPWQEKYSRIAPNPEDWLTMAAKGLLKSELVVLPGTSHITIMERAAWPIPIITEFLDTPIGKG